MHGLNIIGDAKKAIFNNLKIHATRTRERERVRGRSFIVERLAAKHVAMDVLQAEPIPFNYSCISPSTQNTPTLRYLLYYAHMAQKQTYTCTLVHTHARTWITYANLFLWLSINICMHVCMFACNVCISKMIDSIKISYCKMSCVFET